MAPLRSKEESLRSWQREANGPSYTKMLIPEASSPATVVPLDEQSDLCPAVVRRRYMGIPGGAIVAAASLAVLALVAAALLVSARRGAPQAESSETRVLQDSGGDGNFWGWLPFGWGGEETSTTTTVTTTSTTTGTTTSTVTTTTTTTIFPNFAFSATPDAGFKVLPGSPADLMRRVQPVAEEASETTVDSEDDGFVAFPSHLRADRQGQHADRKPDDHVLVACTRNGDNCWETKCCEQAGLYCFEKTPGLAACKASCEPGPDLSDVNSEPWTCNPLGVHTGIHLNLTGRLAHWVQEECASSNEDDNCYESRCCREPGTRCYHKAGKDARCRAECTPGRDPTDVDDKPWTCQSLGPRTPGQPPLPVAKAADWVESTCSKEGSDCFHSGCCVEPGMQCYLKDAASRTARCKTSCTPGVDLWDVDPTPWNCTAVGGRTPGEPEKQVPLDASKLPSWVGEKCAKSGENCAEVGCCADPGNRCYVKVREGKQRSIGWASCRHECKPGPHFDDQDATAWDCEPLGPLTPGNATRYSEVEEAPDWLSASCSAMGENCQETMCCQDEGMQCYERTRRTEDVEGWATCKATCTPGSDYFGKSPVPWTCKELGPRTPGDGEGGGKEIAPWVSKMCTQGNQSNCLETACCQDDGMQCFKKNDTFGVCKLSCSANKSDPTDGQPWSCKEVGLRNPGQPPCVDDGEDCRFAMCCKEKGKMCFEKDDQWGQCMDTCDPDSEETKSWACTPLGIRQYGRKHIGCSWAGDDCGLTKVCCQEEYSCRIKDANLSSCTADFEELGEDWDGTFLGGPRVVNGIPGINGSEGSNSIGASVDHPAGTRLYCFAAAMPGTYEEDLMNLAKEKETHVFACDITDIMDAAASKMANWGSVSNTDVFIDIFKKVIAKNTFSHADWTVKVDPDALFFPDRLVLSLKALSPPANEPIYIKNTLDFNGFLGAIEIFARSAVELHAEFGVLGCKFFEGGSGEDGYFKACMDAIGAKFMIDDYILHSNDDPKQCQYPYVVFHPFKEMDKWEECFNVAMDPSVLEEAERVLEDSPEDIPEDLLQDTQEDVNERVLRDDLTAREKKEMAEMLTH